MFILIATVMSDSAVLITAIGGLIMTFWTIILQMKTMWKVDKALNKVTLVHQEMNGMKEALIVSEKIVSKAEGKLEGIAEQKEKQITKDQIIRDALKDQAIKEQDQTKDKT